MANTLEMTHLPTGGLGGRVCLAREENARRAFQFALDVIDAEKPPRYTQAKLMAARMVLDQWNTEQERDPFRALIAIVGSRKQAYIWMERMLADRDARMLPEAERENEDGTGRGHRDDSGEP